MAARARGLAGEIVAVGRRLERLAPALTDRVVDQATTDLSDGVRGADFVLVATPVAAIEALLAEVWRSAAADAIITDVGSTKSAIVSMAERLARSRPLAFVGGHPMAGSEQSGYARARADLFAGATVILTPTERTEPDALKRVTEFWEALGSSVVTLDPDVHDRVVAAVSHLPHLAAFALVEAVTRLDPVAFDFAGRGFADSTRIAAADPQVWRDILLANREALAETLRVFRSALEDLERLIATRDARALEAALARIQMIRNALR